MHIFVVIEHIANYEDTTTNLVRAFADLASAEILSDELNARPTLNDVIEDMKDVHLNELMEKREWQMPTLHVIGCRPKFDQERKQDQEYNSAYKLEMKLRRRFQKMNVQTIAESKSKFRRQILLDVTQYAKSILSDETLVKHLMVEHKCRDDRASYYVETVEYVAGCQA